MFVPQSHAVIPRVVSLDRPRTVHAIATPAASTLSEKERPDWTGDHWLSRVVNTAISIKPLWSAMSIAAKQVLKSTAKQNGIPWDVAVQELQRTPEVCFIASLSSKAISRTCGSNTKSVQVYTIKEELEDSSICYPEYYVQPFHAYTEGNLNWLAAFEVESATQSMALRTFKEEQLSPDAAQDRLRANIHVTIEVHFYCLLLCNICSILKSFHNKSASAPAYLPLQ